MGRKSICAVLGLATLTILSASCQKSASDPVPSVAAVVVPKKLYVASGACNSGQGTTTYTLPSGAGAASKVITKWDTTTGIYDGIFLDFNTGSFVSGSGPQQIIDNGTYIIASVENATAANRAIIKIPKSDPNNYVTWYANATTLGGFLKGFARDTDGSIIIGRTTAIEKITPAQARATIGGTSWINAPAGNCSVSTTQMNAVSVLAPLTSAGYTNGKIVFAHGNNTAATNRIAIVRDNGYIGATDCLAGAQTNLLGTTPASNRPARVMAFNALGPAPTSMVYIPLASPTATATGRLIVTYSAAQVSNSAAGVYNLNHGIVAWDVLEDAVGGVTLTTAPVVLWDDMSVVYGASAIAYDSSDSSIYVGVAGEPGVAVAAYTTNNVGYNVEKFSYSVSANTLTRVTVNNRSFIHGDATTKCISGLTVGE